MDLSKLGKGDKICGLGAIVAIVGSFLPWWSVGLGVLGGYSLSGLAGIGWLSFIAAVLSLVWVALPLFGQKTPTLPLKDAVLQMILGGVVVAIPIIQLLSTLSAIGGVSFGIFVTVAGGALIIWGGYLKQKEGVSVPPTPES